MKCEVCGDTNVAGVASSCLQAVSYAFCQRCLKEGLEPWGSFVVTIQPSDKLEEFTPEFRELLERNLKFHQKTWEQLQAESKGFWDGYYEYLEEERKNHETYGWI